MAIGKKDPISYVYGLRGILARRHIPQRFSDIRELNASFLIKHLNQTEIDVLHGRVGSSVFQIHYFNIKLVTDLRQRLNQADKEILAKI